MASIIYYGIYLVDGIQVVRMPVNPIDEYRITTDTDNGNYNILSIGEVTAPRIPKLREISWESFFPKDNNGTWVNTKSGFQLPQYYINFIKNIMNNRKPIQLVINRYRENGEIMFDENILVTIESFEQIEKGGETGDFYYSINLKEYREYVPDLVTFNDITNVYEIISDQNTINASVSKQREVSSNVITVGDSVYISGEYYTDSIGSVQISSLSNKLGTVTRLITNPEPDEIYTYYVYGYGWVSESSLRKNTYYSYS